MSGRENFITCATTLFCFLIPGFVAIWPEYAFRFLYAVGIVGAYGAIPIYLIYVLLANGDRFNEDDNGYIHASEWPGAEPEPERTPVPAKREPAVAVIPFRPRRVPR